MPLPPASPAPPLMPIRFACPHCSQKLSVSARKAGSLADCPRCKKELTIPPLSAAVETTTAAAQAPAEPDAATPLVGDLFPESQQAAHAGAAGYEQFVFYDDDDMELVYDTDEPVAELDPALDATRVSIPRYVLYSQGALLGVVGFVCFVLGMLAGGTLFRASEPVGPQPCQITGTVAIRDDGWREADAGAVVIVLPDIDKLDERAPISGLHPNDPAPAATSRGLEIIRTIGGAYARADESGKFALELPNRGNYFLLVISHEAERPRGEAVATEDILKLGRYFQDAPDFLGASRYQLTAEEIRGDRRFNVVFD